MHVLWLQLSALPPSSYPGPPGKIAVKTERQSDTGHDDIQNESVPVCVTYTADQHFMEVHLHNIPGIPVWHRFWL